MKSKHLLLTLLLALLVPWAAVAQTLSEYTITTGSETYTTIVGVEGTTQLTSVTGDYGSQTVALPFQFKFGETTFTSGTTLTVRADGYLYFGSSNPGHSCNSAWTNTSSDYKVIAPFLNYDGNMPSGSGAYYRSSSEMLVIEFVGLQCYYPTSGNTSNYNFQVRLHSNGNISAVYGESTLSTYTSSWATASHNFFLTNGKTNSEKICLKGSYAEPVVGTYPTTSTLPNFTTAPAVGQVITYVRPVVAYPKPTGLQVTSTDHESASLAWTAPEASSNTLTGYAYEYKPASQTDWSDNWTTLNDASATTLTIHELSASTNYNFRIKAMYGSNGSDIVTTDFQTTAQATPVGDGWSDDFEGATCGWELINGNLTNKWCWGTATNNGGTHALYVSNDGGTSTNYSSSNTKIFATKLLGFTDGKYEFNYDWSCEGESGWDFLRVALVPASITLTAGTDYSTIPQPNLPTGWIALDNGQMNLSSAWQTKSVTVNVTAGNYYLVLAWRNDTGVYPPAAAVDNVSITKIACDYDVEDLAVSHITTSSADIAWTDSEAGEWQVAIKEGSDVWEIFPTTFTTNGGTLTPLTTATNYQVKVRAYCDAEHQGAWCEPISFATACDPTPALGYTEDFDDYDVANAYTPSSRTLPTCWKYINECTNDSYKYYPTVYYYSWTDYSNSYPNSLRFYSYYSSDPQPQYAILPEMDNLAGMQVSLKARGHNASSTFKIGTMSNPADASTFRMITEQELTAAYPAEPFVYYIPNTCTDVYLAIMIDAANSTRTYNGVFIDDIEITATPTCWQPQNLNYYEESLTQTEVTLTWQRHTMGDETEWVLQYGTDEEFGAGTYTEVNVTDEPTKHITGLTENTPYFARVKPACDKEGELWSEVKPFTTLANCVAPANLEVVEDSETAHGATITWTGDNDSFIVEYSGVSTVTLLEEGFENGTLPQGWTLTSTGSNNWSVSATVCNGENPYGESDYAAGTPTGSSSRTEEMYLITPAMNLSSVGSATLHFYYYQKNWSSDTDPFGVYYRIGTNGTWQQLFYSTTSTSNWTEKSIELQGLAANYQIGFYRKDNYAYGVAIDNITITGTVASGWVVDGTAPNVENTGTYTFSNLAPETPYLARVKGVCDAINDESDYSNLVTFTTLVACPAPTSFVVAEVETDKAVLNWDADANEAWQIQINDNTVYTDVAYADVTINEGVVTYTLNGLTEDTDYTLKLRANCGTEGYSQWIEAETFHTPEACPKPTIVTVSNIEHYSANVSWTANTEGSFTVKYRVAGHYEFIDADFENGVLPTGWTNEGETDIASWTVGTGDYNVSTGAHNSNYNANIFYQGHDGETYLVTQTMDLSEKSGLNLGLYYINRAWGDDIDGFGIYYRIDGGEWNEIFATTAAHNTWTPYDEPLPAGAYAANCQIGFKFTGDYGYGVGLDDITLGEMVDAGTWNEVAAENSPASITINPDIKYEVVVVPSCSDESGSVPVFFTSRSADDKVFAVEGDWNEGSNWIPEGAPTYEQTAELRANVTITGEAEAASINQSTYSITIENGGKLKANTSVNAIVKKNIEPWTIEETTGEVKSNGWYLITNPITANFTPTEENGFLVGDYDFYMFDFASAPKEWRNREAGAFTDMYSSAYTPYGYLYANNQSTTLTYNGNIKAANSSMYKYASAPNSEYRFSGWYLLGNGFMCDAYVATANTEGNALPFYKMNEDRNGFEAVAATTLTALAPMEGFFYQQSGTDGQYVYVTTTAPEVQRGGQLNMNLRSNNKQLDNAIVTFGNEQKLGKFSFREGSSKIYIPVNGQDFAIANAEGQTGEMPVSFKAEKNGSYTLSFTSQEVSFSYLHLIDNLTGADVNLLKTPSYTFDATTTDYAQRFRLVFATGSSVSNDNFGFVNASGNLCIFGIEGEATLQVIDVTGRVISSNQFSGSYESKLNVAPGVYMLRLINGNDVKVQKIVME